MVPTFPVPLMFLQVLALQSVWSAPQEPKVQSSPQTDISSLHHPTWSLGLQLYRSLRIDGSQTNTFISPLLLANSLLALEHGAKGPTAGQFHDLLGITKNDKAVGEVLTKALKCVREANGTSYTWHISSALFSKQAPKLKKSFLEKLQTHFGLQHVALEDAQKQTDMEKLQSWAKSGMDGEETADLEQALETKPGAMILANALHFKVSKLQSSDLQTLCKSV
ncbi:leukocyte elastase inhibitor B-like [Sinocyclocheilus anshuiensis]|uniref:leukocyte elastase inhibitor B-like n=1 Tax=Sinocyclocheilus anshuiensis TaxID=1608454 RepID=UPI0007B7D79E|nr:PREDICTED: leukocyte elastase inhibitor B-like [Sinocyclocheilus anshuiensis]